MTNEIYGLPPCSSVYTSAATSIHAVPRTVIRDAAEFRRSWSGACAQVDGKGGWINRLTSHRGFLVVATLLLIAGPATAAPAGDADWATTTLNDLAAARNAILADHPGPVDSQQPGFVAAMDQRQQELLPLARAAQGKADWQRVLQDFANGFADVHVAIGFTPPLLAAWPGFLSRTDRPGAPTCVVLAADPAAGPHPGDTLLGCDGHPAEALLAERVLRPLLNPALPQRLPVVSPALFTAVADDPTDQAASCRFRDAAGTTHTVPLRWRPIDRSDLDSRLAEASGIPIPPLGLRRVGDVWFVSIPSFTWENADGVRMQAFLSALQRAVSTLHAARHVVIDLRGNHGGNSAWGEAVASALWSQPAVDAAEATLDWTVEWRPSPGNETSLRRSAASERQGGLMSEAASVDVLADRMAQARAAHHALLAIPGEPHPGTMSPAPSPFTAPVLVLTEPRNISACLDFLDLLARLPGTERIGLPTGADTLDMDIAEVPLPSGRASLLHPMKVFRHRSRGANVAYQPAVVWSGGSMTTDAIARWVDMLPVSAPIPDTDNQRAVAMPPTRRGTAEVRKGS